MKKSSHKGVHWKTQLPVDYIDTSLVINTWETVVADLSGGKPARLWFIIVEQTNNGATAENLELELTINGTAYTVSLAAIASGVAQFVNVTHELTAGDFTLAFGTQVGTVGTFDRSPNKSIPFIAENITLIRVRQITDVDITSAQIEVNLVWDRLEP